ncbi:MAG: N4-gp56 family major capsid protein [Lachnospiraceae bacterium]
MNKNRRLMNLQMFANSNTNVTTDSGMTAEIKTFYDKNLIRMAKANLVHDQFAQTRDIPKNGGKSVEFRQYDPLPKATEPLTEGVTPDGRKLSVKTKTSTVKQYGDYVELSDMLIMTAIDNNIVEATEILGDQAGRTLDSITRDAVSAGTNVIYAGGKTSRKTLTDEDTLKPILFEKAATQLKAANAPKINGCYVAIINPYTSFDLRTSPEWIEVHKYADTTPIFQGEIGMLGKVRFVESTEAKIWKDETCPEGKAVFSTLVVGLNAYATTKVEGGGLQTIVKQLGSGQDPLNQRATVGWKAIKTAKILVEPYMVRIESLSAYSADVEAN